MTETTIPGTLTGRRLNVWGAILPEVSVTKEFGASYPDVVEVDGVAYYVHDLGGIQVGSRKVCGRDYGGNKVHNWRTAPAARDGVAAHLIGLPVMASYSDAEIVFA